MTKIYEIYVYGEFYELWEESSDAYNRAVKLGDIYGDEAISIQEKLYQE